MSFVDKVHIFVRAGSGGDGCLSFRREKFVEFGGPDGGDGGRGGGVALVADSNMGTLLDFARHPHLRGKDGENGKGKNKTGAGAPDLDVSVPVGTVIYKNGMLLADLVRPGDGVLAAKGGRGGRGNLSFKSRRNTAPRIAEKGEPGEAAELELEMKLIADVGLAGFPNAGKSSLLARGSHARPKVADYPFTTLAPHLGLVEHKEASFIMADIPGLIEGAHQGKGLGLEFLRHVERTRMLLHLVDPLGFGNSNPLDGIRVLESELAAFSKALAAKPRALVVTKLDLPEGAKVLAKLKARFRRRAVFGVSSVTGEGLAGLLDFLIRELARMPRPEYPAAKPDLETGVGRLSGIARPFGAARPVRVRPGYSVIREVSGCFRVIGPLVERMASMANFQEPQALERFHRQMKRIGVDRSLKNAGIAEGDVVRIGPVELEWSDSSPEPDRFYRPGRGGRS